MEGKKGKIFEIIFLATIIAAPLYQVRFSLFGVPANMLDFFILSTIFWWIAFLKMVGFRKIIYQNKLVVISTCVLLVGLFLSAAVNGNIAKELGIIKSWFVLPVLFSVSILSYFSSNKDKRRLVITSLAAIYSSVFLIATTSLILRLYNAGITYDGRLFGVLAAPNYLAMCLAPALLIGVHFLIRKKNKLQQIVWIVSCLVIIYAFYLTFSYANWVAAAAGIVIYALWNYKGRLVESKKIVAGLILGVLFFSFLFFTTNFDNDKLRDVVALDERSSLVSRVIIWKSSLLILKENWFLGIGPGNFQETYLEYQKHFPPYLEWAVPQPHNLYLAFWVQTGIVGITGFMLVIVFWFKSTLKINKNSLGVLLAAVMLYMLIYGIVDTPYWKNDLALNFWLIIALGLAIGRK